ncbi:MAG TPA: DUF1684 domain-containing protein [Thermoanaerobaculia bacterium]
MKRSAALLVLLALATSCRYEPARNAPPAEESDVVTEVRDWQATRLRRLQAEDSWLTLVGLYWLNEGDNRPDPDTGTLTLSGGVVTLTPEPGMTIDKKPVTAPTPLADDSNPNGPTVVQRGSKRFQVIKRGDRLGLRVKDANAPTRTHFRGLEYFPIDPRWRVLARFEPYRPVKKIPITDITGRTADSDSPGALVFTVGGQEYRLDPILEEGSDELFIIFRDATSRDTTYQAGRYLYADPPGPNGTVVVDFNKAYNPPCAFTPFATCPLPPLQNRLPIRIEAGEKRYAGGH